MRRQVGYSIEVQLRILFFICCLLKNNLELFDIVFQSLVHLFLNDESLNFDFSVVFLSFEISTKLGAFFDQYSILIVNSFCDIRYQIQMMPQFNFLLLCFGRLIALLRLLFLYSLLSFAHLRLVHPLELLKLLVLKTLQMVIVVIDVFENFPLVLFLQSLVGLVCLGLVPLADAQFTLQLLYLLAVLQLVFLVAFGSADNLTLLLLVSILLAFYLLLQIEVDIIPVVILDFANIRNRVLIHDD